MKFLLGYNMNIAVLWGDKNLVGWVIFPGGRLSKACADDGILVNSIFAIKSLEHSKLLGVYFYSSQPNWETCGNYFCVPQWKVETCYNLALHLIIFGIFKHILFSVNKSNFHIKGRSSISLIWFNNVNFQVKQFVIFQKFSWDSV